MKKIPLWAIYLADLMCLISALLIAGTYFSIGLPMELGVVLLCALMVLSATAIICTAQILQFKYAKLANDKKENTQASNIDENFQIIFKQVTAIKRDNATLNVNFTSLLNRYNELVKNTSDNSAIEKALSNFESLNAKVEEFSTRFAKEEDIASLKLEVEESIENFKADVELDLGKLDDIDSAVKELKNILEDIEEDSKTSEAIEAPAENLQDEEDIEEDELAKADIEEEEEEEEEEESFYSDEDDGIDPSDDLSQIGLMSRALNNTQQSQSVLGSFAKINEESQAPKKDNEDSKYSNDFVDIEDELDDDLADELADIMNLSNEEESSLTINAMLGLGNKPYIRGNAQDLSETQGVQMDFVEIGKWTYNFKNLNGKAKVSIWLNDEKISDNGEITIAQGENIEIDATFSQ